MKEWDEDSDQASKITPDKERAISLLKLVQLREKDIDSKKEEFTILIVEGYYEIIKELITAVMSVDGYKTLSHELLVGYLARFYREFSSAEIHLIDQLRKTINDIAYRGIIINPEYLKRNKNNILATISKLKHLVSRKIKE